MDDIKERHGVQHFGDSAILTEQQSCIHVKLYKGSTPTSSTAIYITPNEARYLASKLRRLAKRVEARSL
jgi:hypothetical protein